MRRLVLTLALTAAALTACNTDEPGKSASAKSFERLDGAPAQLASLYDQENALLGGGLSAYEKRIATLKGRPVVVNAWASWCGPCRFEFPFFQRQAVKRGKQIGFVGLNTQDNDGDAKEFLGRYPLPYPSYTDPDQEIAREVKAATGLPATAYYDRKGELVYTHIGVYATEAKLAEDIERYAR